MLSDCRSGAAGRDRMRILMEARRGSLDALAVVTVRVCSCWFEARLPVLWPKRENIFATVVVLKTLSISVAVRLQVCGKLARRRLGGVRDTSVFRIEIRGRRSISNA